MKGSFERHPDTQAVVDCLRGVNGEISYSEIAKTVKLTTGRLKSVLPSARRVLSKEKIMFGTIIGVGLRRLSDQDKVKKSETNKKRIGRSASRAFHELETVEHMELLPPREQVMATTNRTLFWVTRQQCNAKPPKEAEKVTPAALPDVQKIISLKK